MNYASIRFRLIAGGIFIALLPLTVGGIIATRKSTHAITELSETGAEYNAKNIATQVAKALAGELKTATAFASDTLVVSVTQEVNAKGVAQSSQAIAPLRQAMKRKYQAMGDSYLGIFVTDAAGTLYTGELADGSEYKGASVAKRAYFQQAKTSGKAVVSDVVRSQKTGVLICVACAPVFSTSGQFQGIFAMSMKASALTDLVTNSKMGKTGSAFMINGQGIVIAHPEAEQVLTTNLSQVKGLEVLSRAMLSKQVGIASYTDHKVDRIAGYAPVTGQDWSVAVTQDKKVLFASVSALRLSMILIALTALAVATPVVFWAASTIVKPVNLAIAGLKDIAQGEGDLTKRLAATSKDEIGELARWFNTFIDKLQTIIGDLSNNTTHVKGSIEQLSGIAADLATSATDSSSRADNVATAAEEMSANLHNVAAAMEQSTTNTSMVASAAEQMSATINQIAENAEEAHNISEQAVQQAGNTSDKMAQLGQAAQAINKVTEAITEISEQTNLLALNATIEAARAGEAGKGFAVVANEIKELARQTATATMDIKKQIEGVQGTAQISIEEIKQITTIIHTVNQLVATISTAVAEQSEATQEIANNIAQASQGLGEVNENVSHSSVVAGTITQDIAGVNTASNDIAQSSDQVKASADTLQSLTEALEQIVSTFKI